MPPSCKGLSVGGNVYGSHAPYLGMGGCHAERLLEIKDLNTFYLEG